ncbi:MAG: hypothetical protein A2W25_16945 [candidate division Zixibacteria bacterium RBG_16_53_22]|nr:MAG: hypothetical protein A2W25_16945 [candidate division Zixibacteria bacterium RBG_16_53_22]
MFSYIIGIVLKLRSKEPVIAVVGHLVKDEIVSPNGEMKVSLGGTAYSIAALEAIAEMGRILPVCRVGRDIEPMIRAAFGHNQRLDLAAMKFTSKPNVVNRLVYGSDGARAEQNSAIAPPLELDGIDRRIDSVLLNFISGRDVKLRDLKAFRAEYRGLIYCDYHSLSLGHDRNLRRYYRLHPRYKEYIATADMVQMNLAELKSIYKIPIFDMSAVAKACCHLHETGVKVVIITAGTNGVMVSESKTGRFYHIPAIHIRRQVDPTGCGDTLGAAFLYNYLRTADLIGSLEIANQFAAAKATFSGLEGFAGLGNIIRQIGPPVKAIALKNLDRTPA